MTTKDESRTASISSNEGIQVEKKHLLYNLLKQRTLWLIRLRWFVPPGLLAAIWVAHWIGFDFYRQGVLNVAIFIFVYNSILHLIYLWLIKDPRRNVPLFTSFQGGLDYLALFLLIHYTGGISSPVVMFFIFPVLLASILLKRRATWVFANLAVIGMCGIALLEFFSVIPSYGIFLMGERYGLEPGASMHIGILILFLAAAVYITAFLSSSIMEVLKQRVIDLSISHEEMETLNQLRDRFMLQVAHNLKEPLSATVDMLDVLNREYVGTLNEKQRDYVERIDGRLKTMISMIRDLLILARTREETRKLRLETVDLKEIVTRIGKLYSEKAQRKGIDFHLEMEDHQILTEGDKDMLEQMVENLLSNAIKYTEKGSVEVKLVARSDGWVIFQVKDSGIGIPPEDIQNLFTDFFRARNARKLQALGTGLGLSLIKQTAEQHKGTVEVHSEEGRGSLFTVRLPYNHPLPTE